MQRPPIVCHMATSLDGRLLPHRWPVAEAVLMDVYESTADRLGADGWIVGRRTMAEYLSTGEPAFGTVASGREDRIAEPGAVAIGICFDRQGRLRPESGEVEGDHLVLILSERVAESHVDALVARGVSVVFAGPDGDDLGDALGRIATAFGSTRLLLEGGGRLNAAFLAADLIDETSTLVFPVVDGQRDVPAIYDDPEATGARRLDLIATETLDGGVVWLRHRVERS